MQIAVIIFKRYFNLETGKLDEEDDKLELHRHDDPEELPVIKLGFGGEK